MAISLSTIKPAMNVPSTHYCHTSGPNASQMPLQFPPTSTQYPYLCRWVLGVLWGYLGGSGGIGTKLEGSRWNIPDRKIKKNFHGRSSDIDAPWEAYLEDALLRKVALLRLVVKANGAFRHCLQAQKLTMQPTLQWGKTSTAAANLGSSI